jgi:hypothetical protein
VPTAEEAETQAAKLSTFRYGKNAKSKEFKVRKQKELRFPWERGGVPLDFIQGNSIPFQQSRQLSDVDAYF